MKINLSEKDKKFLKENNFNIDYDLDYNDDEFLEILDKLYFQEVSYVEVDDVKANIFADIADKVANMN